MKSNFDSVSEWLAQLGKERDFTFFLEDDGHCIIPCADNLNCIVEVPDEDDVSAVFIYIPLIQLPEQPKVQLSMLHKALTMNQFGLLTGGCHVGLDTRSNFIVLSFSSIIEALDETLFKYILSDMLKIAPNLRQRLQAIATPESIAVQVSRSSDALLKQAHLNRLKISHNISQPAE